MLYFANTGRKNEKFRFPPCHEVYFALRESEWDKRLKITRMWVDIFNPFWLVRKKIAAYYSCKSIF